MPGKKQLIKELEICAILQGYGADLKPLYDYPVIDLILYSKLLKIRDEDLEPELRPEFIKEMKEIEKQKGIPFKDIDDLRQQIEKLTKTTNPKMKRQGLGVSIDELRKLADKLNKQRKEQIKKLGIQDNDFPTSQKFLIGIINKTPECSDTWEFEKESKIQKSN